MNMALVPKEAFDSGLLDPVVHEPLLRDVKRVVRKAGVPVNMVWSRMSQYCEQDEMDWVRNMRSNQECGLVYVGKFETPVEDRMMAITGACLRNYMDARVLSVQDVIRKIKDDTMPSPTILLIPNFCLEKAGGGDVATWEVALLLGLLMERMAEGKKTILYVHSMACLEKQYGEAFKAHLESKYVLISH